jgi:NADPH:quinone reductase-like Zn-dependent oxidoreductase
MAETQTGLQLHSTVSAAADAAGELRLTLDAVPVRAPADDEIVVRVEAAPINPSDLALLIGPADLATLAALPEGGVRAAIPARRMAAMTARLDQPMPVGNEGAGTVVDAGAAARHLMGRTVAVISGGMYTQYRTLRAAEAMPLPEGTTAVQGASAFVNPLTALSMVEVMKREGHAGLVHTAAASNLGQMLVRIAKADGVPLVNVVRSPAQAALLRDLGAEHVVDSSADGFAEALTDAIAATGATLAFDAIGGGELGSRILSAMERAEGRKGGAYNRYGSTTHKQLYIYGALDLSPTLLDRSYGFAWGVSGWLLTPFLQRIGADGAAALRARVAAELTTTFASRYTATIGLAEALEPDTIRAYARRATGEKYLIDPTR